MAARIVGQGLVAGGGQRLRGSGPGVPGLAEAMREQDRASAPGSRTGCRQDCVVRRNEALVGGGGLEGAGVTILASMDLALGMSILSSMVGVARQPRGTWRHGYGPTAQGFSGRGFGQFHTNRPRRMVKSGHE